MCVSSVSKTVSSGTIPFGLAGRKAICILPLKPYIFTTPQTEGKDSLIWERVREEDKQGTGSVGAVGQWQGLPLKKKGRLTSVYQQYPGKKWGLSQERSPIHQRFLSLYQPAQVEAHDDVRHSSNADTSHSGLVCGPAGHLPRGAEHCPAEALTGGCPPEPQKPSRWSRSGWILPYTWEICCLVSGKGLRKEVCRATNEQGMSVH